ncbi:MAG: hypothetical protein AMXMBFR53_05660 [Gemmatimonadota bacterium]
MSGSGDGSREAARLLRQHLEIGGPDLFLEGLTREEALALAAGLRGRPGPAALRVPDARRAAAAEAPVPPRGTPEPAAPSRAALRVLPASYEALRDEAMGCTRCRLAETRTHVVFSDGAVDARLVVVGEAPGANEDATGLPFVGAAGQFLDLLLATVDLSRQESVYICNVLKCRPPGNRNPLPEEIEACSPFLGRQLELVAPQALLAVGTFAAQALTGMQKPLGKLRGEVHSYRGVPLVVTYHPAALLRNPGWTRAVWDDLQLLRVVMDGS